MGQDDRDWQPVTRFETTQLTYEAAASGLGLTLAIPLISDRFAREQRLVPTLGLAMPIGIDYTLFYVTADIARRAPIRAFVRWLQDMIAVSSADFERWIDAAFGSDGAATGRPHVGRS